jgi:Aminoglycoside-2''''-adenylyltransferase.
MSNNDFADVHNAVEVIRDYEKPWAVCGGWAIDLFIDRVTRMHKDVDFAVLRKNQLIVQDYMLARGWTLEKAINGQLVPWQPGEWIDLPVHVIWCRKNDASPDFVELLFNEVDEHNFRYRKDTSISLPLEKMITSSPAGIPVLAPEIVLLYKSRNPEDPSAAMDFKSALPQLSAGSRAWLAKTLGTLDRNHIWLESL